MVFNISPAPRCANNKDSILMSPPESFILSYQSTHPSERSIAKRLVDIVGAIVGLIITAVISIPIAVLTLIDDPGSIFYSQIRCGHNGKAFRIWKFRSMIKDADKLKHLVKNEANGHIFKCAEDPRITKVGKFLRRTSLDELPQFWNVLKGEMSLVGTRPPTGDEVSQYLEHHWRRLHVKPGLTGEWQVNGRSHIKDFEQVFELDLQYQTKWHKFYDLSLIFKTIYVIVTRVGAF